MKVKGYLDSKKYLLEGIDLNTSGTLSNVAYISQDNVFSVKQTYSTTYLINSDNDIVHKKFVDDSFENLKQLLNEPTGFNNTNKDSILSINDTTRTVSIEPSDTEYKFCVIGKEYTKTGIDSVVFTDIEGIHFIYFDEDGVLKTYHQNDTITFNIFQDKVIVSFVYWDATNKKSIIFGDERHGKIMDGQTHTFLHNILGTQYGEKGGLGLENIIFDGSTSLDSSATFTVSSGSIIDEDLEIIIPATSNPYNFPLFYKDANGNWRKHTETQFPLYIQNSGELPRINNFNGSTWEQSIIDNGYYMPVIVLATNDLRNPIICIQSQDSYKNIVDLENDAPNYINKIKTEDPPLKEFRILFLLAYECKSNYTNSVKSILHSINSESNYIDYRTNINGGIYNVGSLGTDHKFLANLGYDSHIQYVNNNGRTSGQTINGGVIATEQLILSSNSSTSKNTVTIDDNGCFIDTLSTSTSAPAADVRWDSTTGELIVDTSSERFKCNIKEFKASKQIDKLEVVTYNRKDTGRFEVGMIAEQVHSVTPELVYFDKNGKILGYNKADLIPYLVKNIQELNNKVKKLERKQNGWLELWSIIKRWFNNNINK